jgi:hypothetical protein
VVDKQLDFGAGSVLNMRAMHLCACTRQKFTRYYVISAVIFVNYVATFRVQFFAGITAVIFV